MDLNNHGSEILEKIQSVLNLFRFFLYIVKYYLALYRSTVYSIYLTVQYYNAQYCKCSRDDLKYVAGFHRFNASTLPFYIWGLRTCRFWYLWGWEVLEKIPRGYQGMTAL
jgi:hypothetical protein